MLNWFSILLAQIATIHNNETLLPQIFCGQNTPKRGSPYKLSYFGKHTRPPNTLPRERNITMWWKMLVIRPHCKSFACLRHPLHPISMYHSGPPVEFIGLKISETVSHFPIMNISIKLYVPLVRTIEKCQQIRHGSIPINNNVIASLESPIESEFPHQMACQNLILEPSPATKQIWVAKLFQNVLINFHKPTLYSPLISLEHQPPSTFVSIINNLLPKWIPLQVVPS